VVSVVEVPVQLDISEGLKFVSQRESVLRTAETIGEREGVRLRTEVRVAHKTAQALLRMARQEPADVLIIGWRGYSGKHDTVFGSVVDDIVDNTPCDLLVVKFDPGLRPPFKHLLLPTAGGPSARYAARIAGSLLADDGTITLAGVARPHADDKRLVQVRESVAGTTAEIPFELAVERKLLTGKSVAAAVVKEAKDDKYDALIVGATKASYFKRMMFGKIPEQIARYSLTPVILIKHHEGAKTWLSKFLGA
jgi:nucleotide-binding universal stress UspA family protein